MPFLRELISILSIGDLKKCRRFLFNSREFKKDYVYAYFSSRYGRVKWLQFCDNRFSPILRNIVARKVDHAGKIKE